MQYLASLHLHQDSVPASQETFTASIITAKLLMKHSRAFSTMDLTTVFAHLNYYTASTFQRCYSSSDSDLPRNCYFLQCRISRCILLYSICKWTNKYTSLAKVCYTYRLFFDQYQGVPVTRTNTSTRLTLQQFTSTPSLKAYFAWRDWRNK
jgi:hypothetical protein